MHWKVYDGLILPAGKEVIDQIALFEIIREKKYAAIFYNEDSTPIWLTPLLYDKKSAETLSRHEYIAKHKLYLPK